MAQAATARKRDFMRIVTGADEIGTQLRPGQEVCDVTLCTALRSCLVRLMHYDTLMLKVMTRLGVAQRRQMQQRSPSGDGRIMSDFAPAVVVESRRGGQYYHIRFVRLKRRLASLKMLNHLYFLCGRYTSEFDDEAEQSR